MDRLSYRVVPSLSPYRLSPCRKHLGALVSPLPPAPLRGDRCKDGARWQGSVNVGANPGVVCKQVEYLEQG